MKIQLHHHRILPVLLAAIASLCLGLAPTTARDIVIEPSQLPPAARDFISTHFPGVAIFRAERDSDSYEVYLANNIELDFDLTGAWDNIDGNGRALPDSVIPPSILAFVRANHPAAFVTEIDIEHRRGVPTGYEVDLSNRRELTFDMSGNPTGKTASGSGSGGSSGATVLPAPILSTDTVLTLNVGSIVGPQNIPLRINATSTTGAPVRYYAKGLPKGLKLDSHTGEITGQVTAAPRKNNAPYLVTFHIREGKAKSLETKLAILIQPFPAALVGTHEALLERVTTGGTDALPIGKLALTVSSKGSYTARLTHDRKTYSLRGTLATTPGDSTGINAALLTVKRSRLTPLVIQPGDLSLSSSGDLYVVVQDQADQYLGDDNHSTATVRGWAGSHTPVLRVIDSNSPLAPTSNAATRITVSNKNKLTLKSTLGDGSKISASATGSAAGRYLLFVNPYKTPGGVLAGELQFNASGDFNADHTDLVWHRPAAHKDKAWPQGGAEWTLSLALVSSH